jgi:hypothetical protein
VGTGHQATMSQTPLFSAIRIGPGVAAERRQLAELWLGFRR